MAQLQTRRAAYANVGRRSNKKVEGTNEMKGFDTFLRWGIPGWTTFISFIIFVASDYLSANDSTMFHVINKALSAEGLWQTLMAGWLIVGAGIPLGFIIYQIYFYLRWNSPVSRDGLLPPFIVGRNAELLDTVRDLTPNDLTFSESWRLKLYNDEDHKAKWYYLARLITDALTDEQEPDIIYGRHSYLMNMLHSLGASHVGLIIGFFAYLLFKWRLGQAELWWAVVAVVIVFISVFLHSKEDLRNTEKPHFLSFTIVHPAEVFLGSLFFLYFSLNPGLNDLFPYFIPFFFSLLVGLYWGWSSRECRKFIWGLSILLVLIVVLVGYGGLLNVVVKNLNWPILLATLLFASLSLAFLKNRQNAREQLVTMEYYYLHKYTQKKVNDKNLSKDRPTPR